MYRTISPSTHHRATAPVVVDLDDPLARDASLTGAKAANLAVAANAGLPVLPGFALTTEGTATLLAFDGTVALDADLLAAWERVSLGGDLPLVVRSSSTVEDLGTTSMAGVFTSVIDVRGWSAFEAALHTVAGSGRNVPGIESAPMAILVQPLLRPRTGGVLFGADPVTQRRDRLVVAAVDGGPDRLVSGAVDGANYVLSPTGRVLETTRGLAALTKADLRRLAELARRTADLFGGPQDVEWAIDAGGAVRLLQSRAITTLGPDPAAAVGPVLGPGPVAETFPDALAPLEDDLWTTPLRDGVRDALDLTATASSRRLRRSPVVVSVGGRLAVDLDLFGARPARHRLLRKLDPRPAARRLGAAWRVGRLRAAMPALADDLIADLDDALLAVGPLGRFDDGQLVGVLERTQAALRAAHMHEVLAGLLDPAGTAAVPSGATGAGAALAALAEGRARGLTDDEIVAATPGVLALVPPRIGPFRVLPPVASLPASTPPPGPDGFTHPSSPGPARPSSPGPARPSSPGPGGVGPAGAPMALPLAREALRLRVRWLHELSARAALELGRRLVARNALPSVDAVRWLRLGELRAVVSGAPAPPCLGGRSMAPTPADLPIAFRLTPDGEPVAVAAATKGAEGAGGGRGLGPVHQGREPAAGDVLVVATLDPDLASVLPSLGGLVAESGSVLSHLAILAREFGVPTAVGVPDARRRFAAGSVVAVDGATGAVELVEAAMAGPQPEGGQPQ